MNKIKPTKENLTELRKQTKDKFTKLLIDKLIEEVSFIGKNEVYEQLSSNRILNLIEKEKIRNRLNNYKSTKGQDCLFNLRVTKNNRKKWNISVNGNVTLNKLSQLIQKEFDLEPWHLYEFEIGELKFGPKCDEWQEIFDELDTFKICQAIDFTNLSIGDNFKFLYDFGENIKFKIEILDINDGK